MFATPWKPPQRVALFGTSADPPHLGHQSILLWLAQEFDQVAVWAADNPYKEKQSPMSDRAQMLRLLIETLPTKGTGPLGKVDVYQEFSDRYSINSITRARKRWPKARFYFVVGADLLAQLHKWYQSKEIFAQVDILVFPRPGYSVEGPALSALRQLATVHIAQPPYQHDVSSSTFRNTRCQQSASHDAASVTQNIPPIIRDYITEHDLYPCRQPNHPHNHRAKVSTLR
ncbi:MAG: nicotinate-nucleotide adenylyltransferase [Cyanobacteria bacterium J06634_6]